MKYLRRPLGLIAAPLAIAAACGPAPEPSQWTGLGHDPASTFNNAKETKLTTANASRLGRLWATKQYGNVNGAAAVVNDVVYVQSNSGTFAIKASNGQQIWANTSVTGSSSPAFAQGQIFVNDAASVLHALNATNGQEVWQVRVDPHPQSSGFSSPVVYQDYVIVGSSSTEEYVNSTTTTTFRGSVAAYNRVNGSPIWRYYTADPGFTGCSVWSSVAIDPTLGIVYATDGNNYTGQASDTSDAIFALSLQDGHRIWSTQLSKGDVFTVSHPASPDYDFGANPILFDATINGVTRKLVGAGEKSGTFWALDRQTGAVVWHRDASGGSEIIGGMLNNGAYDGSRILIAGNLGTSTGPGSEPANNQSIPIHQPITSVLEALDPATGNVIWERQLPAWVWAPITVANGVGFVAFEKTVQAFDTATGAKLFTYLTEGTVTSAPVAVNGTVYFGSGLTYIVGYPDTTFHALALDATGGTGPVDAGPPPADGTFGAIYQQLIVGRGCNTIFCHGGSAGNLLMTSPAQAYASLVNVPASGSACAGMNFKRVIPGQPDGSVFLDKISNATPACGTVMPPGGTVTVPQALIDQVRAWIQAGAPNN